MKRIEFKYHPNLYSDEIMIHEEGVCNCCVRKVSEYIYMAYSPEDTGCICLSCIHDGSAAEKLNAEFVQFAEEVSDPEKRDELFNVRPVTCRGREKTGWHAVMITALILVRLGSGNWRNSASKMRS